MTLPLTLALVLAVGTFTLAAARRSTDPDLYWHLASARWMVEQRTLLTQDVFSHTAAGRPYAVGEWLGQLLWYAAFSLGGWTGIATLRATLVGVATFFAARATLEVQPRPALATAPLLAALAISMTTWTDRPQLFTLALFGAFLYLLLRAHRSGDARQLWLLPPLALVWANLHGGYALGVVTQALFALAALVERRPHARALVAVAVASTLLAAVTPASVGLLGAFSHATSPPRFIVEERPPDVFSAAGLVFAALFLAALASALVGGVPRDGERGPALWAIVTVPLVWLGLSAQRHLPVAAIALAPFVALAAPAAVQRLFPAAGLPAPRRLRARTGVAGVLAAALLLAAIGAVLGAPMTPDETTYPRGALAALRETRGNLLNEYDWGGYLVWHAPEHPVFIDGRLFVFLPDVFADYADAVDLTPRFDGVLERHHVDVVLLRPSRALAVHLRAAGWTVRAEAADRYVLLVRP